MILVQETTTLSGKCAINFILEVYFHLDFKQLFFLCQAKESIIQSLSYLSGFSLF